MGSLPSPFESFKTPFVAVERSSSCLYAGYMSTIPQHGLYRLIEEANARGERVVVATVAHTRGSTPQRRGAKMLFFESGSVAGTVGGGCIEAEVWAEAREALRTGRAALHHFSLTADEASEEGMVCGGTMDIFLDVWDSHAPSIETHA